MFTLELWPAYLTALVLLWYLKRVLSRSTRHTSSPNTEEHSEHEAR